MEKSVLVIDNPQKCEECQLCKNYIKARHAWGNPDTYEVYCAGIANRTLMEVPRNKKPDWCPLKNIPSKKEDSLLYNAYQKGKVDGYNSCIEEIIK